MSTNSLVVYNSATQGNLEYANESKGFKQLSESLKSVSNPAIICEATGGYEVKIALGGNKQGKKVVGNGSERKRAEKSRVVNGYVN